MTPKQKKALAIISHIGKAHENQDIEIEFDPAKLGMSCNRAVEQLTKEDPDYDRLYKLRQDNNVPIERAPLKLGDFGSKIESISHNILKMKLNYHCFAIVELSE